MGQFKSLKKSFQKSKESKDKALSDSKSSELKTELVTDTSDSELIAKYKKTSRILKIIGGIILFLSFVTQNYLYDKWNGESQGLHSATVEQSIIDKGVLLNEILYFTSKLDNESFSGEELKNIKEQYINQAAIKQTLSHFMAVMSTDLPKQEQIDLMNKLMLQAKTVKDFNSFSELNRSINTSAFEKIQNERQLRIQRIEDSKNIARHIYLVLYLFGTLILLVGVWYER
jgi:hypothetical protein